MKLSRPATARAINTCRVLNLLRDNPGLSKAALARMTGINKVSVGEIVDDLSERGLVRAAGKIEVSNGRRPTALELVPDAALALGIDIGPKTCTIALGDMNNSVIRFERIPTEATRSAEDFCVSLIKSAMRSVRLAPEGSVAGIGITVRGCVSPDGRLLKRCPFLPWPDIPLAEVMEKSLGLKAVLAPSLQALVRAENPAEDSILYIDWGESISAALVRDGRAVSVSEAFGHLKVSDTALCTCGSIGCLEACASSLSIGAEAGKTLAELWDSPGIDRAIGAMARAIVSACAVCGCGTVILGGQGSTIPPQLSVRLRESVASHCPRFVGVPEIRPSSLGERANMAAAVNLALDEFLFHSSFLSSVRPLL